MSNVNGVIVLNKDYYRCYNVGSSYMFLLSSLCDCNNVSVITLQPDGNSLDDGFD